MSTQTAIALPAWALQQINDLDAADQRAKELAEPLTLEQLNWQPGPAAWSIGQCIDHLRLTNEVYLAPIMAAMEGKSPSAIEKITPGWPSRWFIRNFIAPSPNAKRAPAPKKIVPVSRVDLSILNQFLSTNQTVREFVHRASTYDVNRIRFKNPFVSGVRFTVGTGLLIICNHQRRHLLQAERVRQSLNFPK